jgi:Ca2+-binding RTX toxin-like protein
MIQALETRQMLSSGPIGFNDPVLVIPALSVEYHVKVAIDRGVATARITYVFSGAGYTVQTQLVNVSTDTDGRQIYNVRATIQNPTLPGPNTSTTVVAYLPLESIRNNHGGPLEPGHYGLVIGDGASTFTSVPFDVPPQVSATLNNGVLTVTGDENDNQFSFSRNNRFLEVIETISGQDNLVATFPFSEVKQIMAYGNDGDDLIVVGPKNIPSTLIGGRGNDTLSGSAADDLIDGGRGDDFLSGGSGVDSLSGGRGDGNDTVNGGPGRDTLTGGGGDDTRQISVDTDDAVDLFEHFDDLGLDHLPFTIRAEELSTRIRSENGTTTLRLGVTVTDSGYSVAFGPLVTNGDGSLSILLAGTQVGANYGVLPALFTRVSYYDLTGLAPGMHSLHIEQAAGLITTIQFQR